MTGIPLRAEPTDLRALLTGALGALRDQANQFEIALTIEAPADLPKVDVDAEKIAWAVATLVGNALRFVRHGTRRLPGGSIVVRLGRVPGAVTVAVEDDGPGIPPDKVPWLFERKPGATHAAGLGLMLIHDVVTAHGGTVDVRSAVEGPERGTRITLRLPA
jgi:signal transduction histidine kinase